MIHLPLELGWNVNLVLPHIVAHNISAYCQGDTVVVPLPDDRGNGVVRQLSRWLHPPLAITVSYNTARFIRNIDLSYDPLRMPLDFPCFHEIHSAMSDFGCMTSSELDVALHYYPTSSDIPKLFEEIECLELKKEELVRQQDFESAARARDDGNLLRTQVDDILREHLGIPMERHDGG
ncbi:UvrB/UvrC motif-containing protein [Allorhodopirellula heiligendammensis]|uniref:UvrB/UvrC motif-containing protein n=1 Tax=Allorhodopirellula heiligendammensis TaxID=2714739 RepID=UPI0011B5268B|nr:UvrB/UvrC motif-containing protein [Allorhodopirellula heiligendammensis]